MIATALNVSKKNVGSFADFRQVKKIDKYFFLTQFLTIVYIASEFNLAKK